jgi:nucleoporin NDC1
MWELDYISRDFELRRKAIFEDIDRKDGPMWSQVYMICLSIVKGMESRIDDYGKAPAQLAVHDPVALEPRSRVAAPLKDDPIFRSKAAQKTMRGEVGKAISQVTRSPGHSPASQLSPVAKKAFRSARDKVLSKEQQDSLSTGNVISQLEALVLQVAQWGGADWVLRQTFRRRLTAVILGTPYAELGLYVHAINSLSLLSVHSLSEDKFGNVHRDVPTIIRTFTTLIRKLEAFKARFPFHWTDVEKDRSTPEVDRVLEALRAGLGQVISEFEPYSGDLRLTLTDVRLAKEAAANPEPQNDERKPEMQMVKS